MKLAHMQRRLKKLEKKICPNRTGYTMEELCRLLWRQSKKEYISMAHTDCPHIRCFIDLFEREERHARQPKKPATSSRRTSAAQTQS
jgi:hypothetical protein